MPNDHKETQNEFDLAQNDNNEMLKLEQRDAQL